jgi:hypothetical protein
MNRGESLDREVIGSISTAVTKTPGTTVGVGLARGLAATLRGVEVAVGCCVAVDVGGICSVAITVGTDGGDEMIVAVAVFPVCVDGTRAESGPHPLTAIAAKGTSSAMRVFWILKPMLAAALDRFRQMMRMIVELMVPLQLVSTIAILIFHVGNRDLIQIRILIINGTIAIIFVSLLHPPLA